MKILNSVLLQTFLIFVLVGGMAGLLVGIGLLLRPEGIVRLNHYFSRWVSTDRLEQELDRPRWIERMFYRHSRLVGGFLLVGAVFILYVFLFAYNLHAISPSVAHNAGAAWLLDATVGVLLVGSTLAAVVGAIVMVRPSLLRNLESSANRWVGSDSLLKVFNSRHDAFDRYLLSHSRIAGVCIIAGSLYTLVILSYFLLRGAGRF